MVQPVMVLAVIAGLFLLSRGTGGAGADEGGPPLTGFLRSLRGPGGGSGVIPAGGASGFISTTSGTDPTGLLAASADEDIGIAPQGPLRDPFVQPVEEEAIAVEVASTPVISQAPTRIPVTLTGTVETGFRLVGDDGPFRPDFGDTTPILVAGPSIAATTPFSTTPDALTRFLTEVVSMPSRSRDAGNERFNLIGAVLAEEMSPTGSPGELESQLRETGNFAEQFGELDALRREGVL